jgi:hypothetical protein
LPDDIQVTPRKKPKPKKKSAPKEKNKLHDADIPLI